MRGLALKTVLVSDIHGQYQSVSGLAGELESADLVLAAGDLTNFGDEEAARRVTEAFTRYNRNFYAVPGNCDPAGVDRFLESAGMSLHARRVELEAVQLVGVGGSLPCPGRTPNEEGEEFFRDVLEAACEGADGDKPLILVTHQPAYGVKLDRLTSGGYSGSREIRAFIERQQPLLAVSGHIHEAAGTDRIGSTLLVNPGALREGRYATVTLADGAVSVAIQKV